MANSTKYLAYSLAVLSIVVALVLFQQNRALKTEVADLQTASQRSEESPELGSLERRLQEVEAERDALTSELDATAALVEELSTDQGEDGSAQTNALDPSEPDASTDEEEAEEESDVSLDKIREALTGNVTLKAQFSALSNMTYADLFLELDLEPNAKAALRDLLLDSQMEELVLARYAMKLGDVTGREYAEWKHTEQDRLAAELEELLSADEYEIWAEYVSTIDARALEGTLANQIRVFSSELTDENYDLVLRVAVDEFLAEQNALENSDTLLFSVEESIYYQLRAMDGMRERLKPVLDADQYEALDNWLRMGDNVLRGSLPKAE